VSRARSVIVAGALALAVAVLAPAALACPRGYSYAGLYSQSPAPGIAATVSMLNQPTVIGATSHVAGWVGVGGPGLGPHGEDEWLQVGLVTFGDSSGGRLYYELAQPGQAPRYTELASGIQPWQKVRVAVVELPFAPDTWIVASPVGIAGPFYLPGSHRTWEPIATAENYAENTQCGRYAYRFGRVQLAGNDGSWRPLRRASKLQDPGWRLRRHGPATFSVSDV
jgi:hypothetical protein